MGDRRTNLLMILVLAAAATTLFARSRLSQRRNDALAVERDLAACRGYLAEMAATGAVAPQAARLTPADGGADINRRLRDAAAAAGAAEKLTSIEPGNTETVGESAESSVFLHLEPITMRELVAFLYHLTAADAAVRAKAIELEAPPDETQGEAWLADVAIGYAAPSIGNPGGERVELP